MKTCTVCKETKPLDRFYRQHDGRSDRRGDCIPCVAVKSARRRLWTRYGLHAERYDEMLAEQGGVCAICGQVETLGKALAVDHDHQTGRVRGLLCGACNRGIGYLQDDPALLECALIYLRRA